MSYRVELWDGTKLLNCWEGGELEDLLFTNEPWTIYDEVLAEIDTLEEDRSLQDIEERGEGLVL